MIRPTLIANGMCLFLAVAARAQECRNSRVYVMLDGRDTVSVERLQFGPTEFRDAVTILDQKAYTTFSGRLNSRGGVDGLATSVWEHVGDTAHAATQTAHVTFTNRAILAMVDDGFGHSQAQVDSVSTATLPYMDNLLLFLEIVNTKGRLSGRDSVQTPIAWLFTVGRHEMVTYRKTGVQSSRLTFTDFSVEITIGIDRGIDRAARSDGVVFVRTGCTDR